MPGSLKNREQSVGIEREVSRRKRGEAAFLAQAVPKSEILSGPASLFSHTHKAADSDNGHSSCSNALRPPRASPDSFHSPQSRNRFVSPRLACRFES